MRYLPIKKIKKTVRSSEVAGFEKLMIVLSQCPLHFYKIRYLINLLLVRFQQNEIKNLTRFD